MERSNILFSKRYTLDSDSGVIILAQCYVNFFYEDFLIFPHIILLVKEVIASFVNIPNIL